MAEIHQTKQVLLDGDGEFKSMEGWEAIQGHFDGADGATADPTITGKTVNQRVMGGLIKDSTFTLPSGGNDKLTNMDYHKAAGGGDIPMTYG